MGRGARRRPKYLAAKLREIRHGLGLSQGGIVKHLGLTGYINQAEISDFETGVREPDLLTLKAYADGAGTSIDCLVDDGAKLPEELPGAWQARGLSGKPQTRAPQKQSRAPKNTTTVTLQLLIKSDEGSSRKEGQARRTIESDYLKQYGMKKLNGAYELIFSYQGDADLDKQIYTLYGAIVVEANRRKCSTKVTIREQGTDRYW